MSGLQPLAAEVDSNRSHLLPGLHQQELFSGPLVRAPVNGKYLSVTNVQHKGEIPNLQNFLRNLMHY